MVVSSYLLFHNKRYEEKTEMKEKKSFYYYREAFLQRLPHMVARENARTWC